MFKPGDKVTYKQNLSCENGIVKSVYDELHVFVVYHCDNNWDDYQNYTAAKTAIEDLVEGWT
jgi:hypothetical protein